MNLKEMIQEDNKVFLNLDEFGETHEINGKDMTVIIESNTLNDNPLDYAERVFTSQIKLYVRKEDFGYTPAIEEPINVDGEPYTVTPPVHNDNGILVITLEANRV
ncbi:hypothetical protein [Chengkuizengella axinellae]|uniref:Uncharacterized protein n=1 Tax=Chengkuizengella axinellae TaxID=3064388 RepID=A0ABT9J697_9BACL|nr:hypothetical protein [Chengkuizengella sp. 2205SS18-9]MDP5277147.1 hypothetical protein [Chengkuizengella sp. 2205SS18-9]